MNKQILTLMLGAIVFATGPAFGMESGSVLLDKPKTSSPYKERLQKKLEKLDDRLRAVRHQIQDEMDRQLGGPESTLGQLDPRIVVLQAKQSRIREQMELCDRVAQLLLSQTNRPFNGTLLIAEKDKIIFEDARGERGSPKLQSQFLIGSLSKQITAAMVGYSVQEGLLNFHAPIKAYLPEVNDPWVDKVTLHHLLNHTSGLKAIGGPLEFEPGTQFSYSNEAYDLIGKILEKVTGTTYIDLAENLFDTLEMKGSFSPKWEKMDTTSSIIEGYIENEKGEITLNQERRKTTENPSGGLISSVHDLLKWNVALHDGKLLRDGIYQQMITPSSQRENRWGTIGYGYGLHINNADGFLEICHNGIISGYLSTLNYYPHNKISIIILENKVLWTEEWDIETQKQVFYLHDQIRDVVKKPFAY